MTEFTYSDTQDFNKMLEEFPCLDKCFCGGIIEMSLEYIKVTISEKMIEVTEVPMLKCKKCGNLKFPNMLKKF